jgi:hypothetical protein
MWRYRVSRASREIRTGRLIEADADKLISYNLSFLETADAIRGFSVDSARRFDRQ